MNKRFLYFFAFLLFSFVSFSQNKKSVDYHPPLNIPLVLAANFGELRPNHFHMGVDFKTNGRIGYNIYSVEEGYVSRIKVSSYGYGKALYIDHPNGVTSVYAHCSEYKGAIDSIVKLTQIKEKNFEIEIFLKKDQIKVKRGEIVAISGNTGGSSAPHLHFELRDTKTEHALNPLVYGFDLADTKKPEIRGVKIYGITEDGYVFPNKETKRNVALANGKYYVTENKITIPSSYLSRSGGIGLAFDVIDRLDGAGNQCGLYGSELIVNGDTLFGQCIDRVPFESSRYVNSHKDYHEYQLNKKNFHKSFRTRENDLPIYKCDNIGVIKAKPGDHLNVNYVAYDSKGNTSQLNFELVISEGEINKSDAIANDFTYLKPSQSLLVENGKTQVEFGITTVYEPLKIDDKKINSVIGVAETPVHKAYRINIHSNEKKDGKHYVEMVTAKGSRRALKTSYKDDVIYCESTYFGQYKLKRDTIAPSVIPSNFSNATTYTSLKKMQWKISDAASGLADYDLFIDGEWQLLEYEYKNGLITYIRDAKIVGLKEVKLLVKDECGNVNEWTKTITFN